MSDKTSRPPVRTLAQPDTELANYLDTLLAEIDVVEEAVTEVVETARVKEAVVQADMLQERVLNTVAPSDSPETGPAPGQLAQQAGPPPWAESPFQVLRFSVNGVGLVVPLMSLAGILPLDRTVSHLPGQPAWSLGVVLNHDTKVVAIDTQRLLMPEAQGERPDYTHLLLIGEGDRGLAVDRLDGTATLDKEAIRWRGETAGHPWYAGILVEELSVVIDVDGVMGMLAA